MQLQRFSPNTPHPVRSEALINGKTKRKPPRIGFLRPGHVERAFIALLYLSLLALVLLSIVGTFYGLGGNVAPLLSPRQMIADIAANTDRLWVALAIQLFLTLTQYGARQFITHDRRWWAVYLVSLSVSVYYNVQAYWTPLIALLPAYIAGILIVAGDVLPEFIGIRHE
jgi:hypothetical protein